jgi:hypothetical protein
MSARAVASDDMPESPKADRRGLFRGIREHRVSGGDVRHATAEGEAMTSPAVALPRKRSKYSAVPTEVDGIRFDSKKEARRYADLKLLERTRDGEDEDQRDE